MLRVMIYLECNHCHEPYEEKLVAARDLQDDLEQCIHELVLRAEEDQWECRKNATEHYCSACLEPWM